jgi:hypothetical protein
MLVSHVRRESMADRANSRAGIYLTGTTRHLPAGHDHEYFCQAVANLYARHPHPRAATRPLRAMALVAGMVLLSARRRTVT